MDTLSGRRSFSSLKSLVWASFAFRSYTFDSQPQNKTNKELQTVVTRHIKNIKYFKQKKNLPNKLSAYINVSQEMAGQKNYVIQITGIIDSEHQCDRWSKSVPQRSVDPKPSLLVVLQTSILSFYLSISLSIEGVNARWIYLCL